MAEKARVAVLLSGRGSNMAALLYAAKQPDCPYQLVLVASNRPEAEGLRLAAAEGIPTFAHPHRGLSREEHDAIMDAALRKADADYVALAGYMRILSPGFVQAWDGRMLNIHPSLLPKYKGLDTYQRALDAGDSVAGCTVHLVTPDLDDGPILGQTEVAILPGDTADTLAARILMAEHQLYPRMLSALVSQESDPAWITERIGALALALPESDYRPSHGSAGWRVGGAKSGRYFAYVSPPDLEGSPLGLLVKTSGPDEQAALIEAEPELYFLPRFYAPSGWIGVRLDKRPVDWAHVEQWLAKSWRQVAPARLTRLMDIADSF